MSATTDLQQCWEEKSQREDTFAVRAALENCINVIDECHHVVGDIVAKGSFDTIPADLKQTLNRWWSIIKNTRTEIISDSDIMDVYNWRP